MNTAPFTCDAFDAVLPDLLEDTLDPGARTNAVAHADGCARCRGILTDLAELRAEAARLPVLKASRDLWDGISARIETPAIALRAPLGRPWWAHPARVAAAAALLVAGTATATWTIARQPAAGTDASAGSAEPDGTLFALAPGDSMAAPVLRVEAAYDPEIAELRVMLAERPPALDSATARVLEENLRIIDAAIDRARSALEAAPGSRLLARQLARAYDMKLNTLRRIATMPVEVGP